MQLYLVSESLLLEERGLQLRRGLLHLPVLQEPHRRRDLYRTVFIKGIVHQIFTL